MLLANGDTFDDSLLKPYHGVAWLENLGKATKSSLPGPQEIGGGQAGVPRFAYHRLADMPGPHSVRAADLDGDGDLDVIASALVAGGAGDADATLPWRRLAGTGVERRVRPPHAEDGIPAPRGGCGRRLQRRRRRRPRVRQHGDDRADDGVGGGVGEHAVRTDEMRNAGCRMTAWRCRVRRVRNHGQPASHQPTLIDSVILQPAIFNLRLDLPPPFHNRHVPVDRQVLEPLLPLTRPRPRDLQPIELVAVPRPSTSRGSCDDR